MDSKINLSVVSSLANTTCILIPSFMRCTNCQNSLSYFCSYEGPELELWSLGVLLYTLLFSENPFCDVGEILTAKLKTPFPLSPGTALIIFTFGIKCYICLWRGLTNIRLCAI